MYPCVRACVRACMCVTVCVCFTSSHFKFDAGNGDHSDTDEYEMMIVVVMLVGDDNR